MHEPDRFRVPTSVRLLCHCMPDVVLVSRYANIYLQQITETHRFENKVHVCRPLMSSMQLRAILLLHCVVLSSWFLYTFRPFCEKHWLTVLPRAQLLNHYACRYITCLVILLVPVLVPNTASSLTALNFELRSGISLFPTRTMCTRCVSHYHNLVSSNPFRPVGEGPTSDILASTT